VSGKGQLFVGGGFILVNVDQPHMGVNRAPKAKQGTRDASWDSSGKTKPEYQAIRRHVRWILYKTKGCERYFGRPLHPAWNKQLNERAYKDGMLWLLDNLGPSNGRDLHLKIPEAGLVPGNLEWKERAVHKQAEPYAKLSREKRETELLVECLCSEPETWANRRG
jgi:hypothetical protein